MESLYLFRPISVSNMAGSVDRSADKMEGSVGWYQPAPQHRGHKSESLWGYSRAESNAQDGMGLIIGYGQVLHHGFLHR